MARESSSLNLSVAQPKPIEDITPFSALDYPEHLSAIIWFAGCNMRCQYCYNPEIVFSKGSQSIDDALLFLRARVGLLDGVVLSGGEATFYSGITAFCEQLKSLGYKIKLDTNGTYDEVLKELLRKKLVDYVALDYKAPLQKFSALTKNHQFGSIEKSLMLLIEGEIDFEVRTTLHSDLLDEDDINTIIDDLYGKGYKGTYYIQQFVEDVDTIGKIQNPQRVFDKEKISTKLEVIYR